MAEDTRLKTIEENVRKQEAKLQTFMESTSEAPKSMEEKMLANSTELKTLVAGIAAQNGGRVPKLEFSRFAGEYVRDWIQKCETFFHLYGILGSQKMLIAEMHLEGRANVWFQSFKRDKRTFGWEEFKEGVSHRFGDLGDEDGVEEFNKLQQSSTVMACQEKFEELRAIVLLKNPGLSESYFVSSYLSGLQEELKALVKMHKPQTLQEAFEVAKWKEKALEVIFKKSRASNRLFPPTRMSSSREISTHRPPVTKATTVSEEDSTKQGNMSQPYKRITPTDFQYRKDNYLCFKCGAKFRPGHMCKDKGVHMIIATDLEDRVDEEEVIEYMDSGNKPEVELSLHSLIGNLLSSTIKLLGKVRDSEISILLDGGSSNCFLKKSVAQRWQELVRQHKPFKVRIANGQELCCSQWIPNFQWSMQGQKFCHNVYLLDLEPYDLIIGVDWMNAYSPLTFDFKQLQVFFSKDSDMVTLRGDQGTANTRMTKREVAKRYMRKKLKQAVQACTISTAQSQVNTTPNILEPLLIEFQDVFSEPKQLPPTRSFDHQIPLKIDAKPFKLALYRYPHVQKTEIEKQVKEILHSGIIQPSHSPFASPVLLVKKKDEYLGHVVTGDGVSADSSKVEYMVNWPEPTDVKALRGFLGLTEYYRRFVKNYGSIVKPLTDLLRKDGFGWNKEASAAFRELKQAMSTTPVLALPDFSKPFVLETDASNQAIGAIIMQQRQPLAYMSQALGAKNQALSIYEKELLALIVAVNKWRHYLLGSHFIIRIDHHSQKYLLEQKIWTPLQQKWLTKLMRYDYEIQFKRGRENVVADALSRRGKDTHEFSAISMIKPVWITDLAGSYEQDPKVKELLTALAINGTEMPEYSYNGGAIKYRGRVYVGAFTSLRQQLIACMHMSAVG
ncbi:uncharacterized protein [Coffea arabica]|uniref:Uncharacterized protein n=1 Tax=Coffea arabica TaxID=13443 RepID=A0ABM4U676_COFAR